MIERVKISKKKLFYVILGFIFAATVSVCILILWNDREPNRAEGEDLQYYTKIEAVAKTQEQITLSDIFTFDWDRVYIQANSRMSEDELSGKLGFYCDSSPLEDWFGYPYRVLFIKDNKIVYDFLYDQIYLEFVPKELMLNKSDATFTRMDKGLPITLSHNK